LLHLYRTFPRFAAHLSGFSYLAPVGYHARVARPLLLFYLLMPRLEDAHKYQLWLRNLRRNGVEVHGVDPVFTKFRADGDLLFGLVNLDATVPEGHKILPLCFLKGEVVSVLVCFIDQDTDERYLLLVRQRRICNGALIYEHPAGMVDGTDAPLDVALREVEEETGLTVRADQVHALNTEPLFPSSGTSDEAMYFYYAELCLRREEIFRYDGQSTGSGSENEFIQTCVVPLAEARRRVTNACGLLNIYLYEAAIRGESPF
jgi:ADP-sugar diphosphatase